MKAPRGIVGSPAHVALWKAIGEYAAAADHVARSEAVVAVETALSQIVASDEFVLEAMIQAWGIGVGDARAEAAGERAPLPPNLDELRAVVERLRKLTR